MSLPCVARIRPTFLAVAAALLVLAAAPLRADAQAPRGGAKSGYDMKVDAAASSDELTAQPDIWILEVRYKPLRMIRVDVTDPKTREKKREVIWYLVYQTLLRPQQKRETVAAAPANGNGGGAEEGAAPAEGDAPPDGRPIGAGDLTPVNLEDPRPGPPLFVPEFTLVTDDNGVQQIYEDVIIPEAQAAIIARERIPLKNSVQIVQPLPQPTPYGAATEHVVDGVAMWRKVNPETDFFRILLSGFSNGFQVAEGPDGSPLIARRTIVQKYWRPGDEFYQDEAEIRREGAPVWIYRPDAPRKTSFLPDLRPRPEGPTEPAPPAPVAEVVPPPAPTDPAPPTVTPPPTDPTPPPAVGTGPSNPISDLFKFLDKGLKGGGPPELPGPPKSDQEPPPQP